MNGSPVFSSTRVAGSDTHFLPFVASGGSSRAFSSLGFDSVGFSLLSHLLNSFLWSGNLVALSSPPSVGSEEFGVIRLLHWEDRFSFSVLGESPSVHSVVSDLWSWASSVFEVHSVSSGLSVDVLGNLWGVSGGLPAVSLPEDVTVDGEIGDLSLTSGVLGESPSIHLVVSEFSSGAWSSFEVISVLRSNSVNSLGNSFRVGCGFPAETFSINVSGDSNAHL